VAFVGRPRIPNRDYVLSFETPEFKHFSGNAFVLWGNDENFFEWASANITWLDLTLDWRPSDKLRVNGLYRLQYVGRRTDGSTVSIWRSPRLKLEYQLSRPIFLRLVGEYTTERRDALRDDTCLVSVMLASNEIGVIQPLADIAGVCKRRGVLLHCDATQAVGKTPVHVHELGVDLMSFSAHKMYGPKGIGALYIRSRDPVVRLETQIIGGGQQEGRRSGTLNVPGVVGFAAALSLCLEELPA
jgi:hypothetical protein